MYNPKSLENLTRRGHGREPGNPNKVTMSVRKKIAAVDSVDSQRIEADPLADYCMSAGAC